MTRIRRKKAKKMGENDDENMKENGEEGSGE